MGTWHIPGEDDPRLSPCPRAGLQQPPLRGEAGDNQMVLQSRLALSTLMFYEPDISPSCHPPGSPVLDGSRNADGWPEAFTSPSRFGRFGTRWLLHRCGWTSSLPTQPVTCPKLYIRISWEVLAVLTMFTGRFCFFFRNELGRCFCIAVI